MISILSSWRAVHSLRMAMLALVVAVFTWPVAVLAHGGEDHDHGDQKQVSNSAAGPRAEAQTELFELVAIPSAADGGSLRIYLQDFRSNLPITDAKIDVTQGEATTSGVSAKGVYVAKAPWVAKPGTYDLTFAVSQGEKSDLLIATLAIPAGAPAGAAHESIWDHVLPAAPDVPLWMPLSIVVAALGAVAIAFKTSRVVRLPLLVVSVTAALTSVAAAALIISARHTDTAGSTLAAMDRPAVSRKLADGSTFVPEPSQRLLGIATTVSDQAENVELNVRLIGQVVPNPNSSGMVQALVAGRLEAPEGGFPAVGSPVKRGDILGYLAPRVELVDRSDIRQTQGDLDRQIELAEAKLRRIEPLGPSGAVAKADIIDARIELENLKKRRTAIQPVLGNRDELKSPVDGVLAQANVAAGQVVEAQALLFQVVQPEDLWVEALAYDSASARGVEQAGKPAYAITSDGRRVELEFVGRSLTLRQQAVPLQFRVKAAGVSLDVNEPVTVLAPQNATVEAMALPRSAVVRSSNGESIVYAHTGAERFEQRLVRTTTVDNDRVGILSGLEPGTRVVSRGAELINQVR